MKHRLLNSDQKPLFAEADAEEMDFVDDHPGALELARILAKIKGETVIIEAREQINTTQWVEVARTYVHPPTAYKDVRR